jgi:hypothetical protein
MSWVWRVGIVYAGGTLSQHGISVALAMFRAELAESVLEEVEIRENSISHCLETILIPALLS